MAAQKKENKINLLPQEEFAASTLGRILKWLLSSFRFIVITTEMVVMLAFLSRFWLDAENADLGDTIKAREAVISSFKNVERDMRRAQNKLNLFSLITKDEDKYLPILSSIAGQIPSDVQVTFLNIAGNQVDLKVTAVSEQSASFFIENLKKTNLFSTVNLTQVSTDQGATTISFSVSANLKEDQNSS